MIAHAHLLITLALLFGFFMAWGVGANDVANAMGTSVGSKVLSIKQAIIIAALFEAGGALLASGQVTSTIRNHIIDVHWLAHTPELFVFGMMAALFSAGIWLAAATYFGWPVSTTHTIIGALVGFGAVGLGFNAVHWDVVSRIVLSWFVTPIFSGIVGYLLFMSVYHLILNAERSFEKAQRYLPVYLFFVVFLLSLTTLVKGLQHVGWSLTLMQEVAMAAVLGLSGSGLGVVLLRRIRIQPDAHRKVVSAAIERAFGVLTVFTACGVAFAHGSNDVANAIAPLDAIIDVVRTGSVMSHKAGVPMWILSVGAVGIIVGLATCGYRVIATIGSEITLLTPSRAFSAQLATAGTVVLASGFGLPVSTTQTLVGAVLGVGCARGMGAVNFRVIGNVFASWLITLPVGAVMSIGFFYLLRTLLG